jgi:hypothetical protein
MVSIIALNRYSIAYQQAFLRGDLQAAKAAIGATETTTILEFALTGEYPYKLLARFFQIIARKA